MLFFYSFTPNKIADRIRELCKLPPLGAKSVTQMVLLDIPDNGGYYLAKTDDITQEIVGSFLHSFKAGTLERLQLG